MEISRATIDACKIMPLIETLELDKEKNLFGQEVARLSKLSRSQGPTIKPEFKFTFKSKKTPKSQPNPPIAL